MTREKHEKHLASLTEVHTLLDKEIDAKLRNKNFKDEEIESMKKKRLQIKDQIESIKKIMRDA